MGQICVPGARFHYLLVLLPVGLGKVTGTGFWSLKFSAIVIFLSALFTPPLNFSYAFWPIFGCSTCPLESSWWKLAPSPPAPTLGRSLRWDRHGSATNPTNHETSHETKPFSHRGLRRCLTCKDANSTSTSIKTNNAHLEQGFFLVSLPYFSLDKYVA